MDGKRERVKWEKREEEERWRLGGKGNGKGRRERGRRKEKKAEGKRRRGGVEKGKGMGKGGEKKERRQEKRRKGSEEGWKEKEAEEGRGQRNFQKSFDSAFAVCPGLQVL